MKTLDQIKMFEKVNETLEKNLSKWDNLTAFHLSYDLFMRNLVKLKKLELKLVHYEEPVQIERSKLLNQLVKSVIPVANILEVYGSDRNKKLEKTVRIDRDKFIKAGDPAIMKKCKIVLEKSRKLFDKAWKNTKEKSKKSRPSVLEYGLTESMINKFGEHYKRYKEASDTLNEVEEKEKKTLAKLKSLVSQNNKVLITKFDKLIVLFESKAPAFFDSYIQSRIIEAGPSDKKKSSSGKRVRAELKSLKHKKQTPATKQIVSV
jgi:hypothetical protein